jgi:hypothetical protein
MNRQKILPAHIAIDIVTGILLEELDQTTGCKKAHNRQNANKGGNGQ